MATDQITELPVAKPLPPTTTQPAPSVQKSRVRYYIEWPDARGVVAALLVAVGIFWLIGALAMRTTVEGVHNIGLLFERQSYLICGWFSILTGVILHVSRRHKS